MSETQAILFNLWIAGLWFVPMLVGVTAVLSRRGRVRSGLIGVAILSAIGVLGVAAGLLAWIGLGALAGYFAADDTYDLVRNWPVLSIFFVWEPLGLAVIVAHRSGRWTKSWAAVAIAWGLATVSVCVVGISMLLQSS